MIIESHAHYSHKRFDGAFRYLTGELTAREGQREDLLNRLRESGVVLSIEPSTLSPTAGPLPCTGSIRTSSAWRWACTPPGPIRLLGGSAGSWRPGPGSPAWRPSARPGWTITCPGSTG